MTKPEHIVDWVFDAIDKLGERAGFVKVAEEIWQCHESELRASADLFFVWQTIYRRERGAAEFFVRRSLYLVKKKKVAYDAAEHDLPLIKSIKRQMVRESTSG
ncbi:MAG: hypothetical protein PVF55_08780 [Desulfobacterales bacterium]|jgi:hypothetical protein